MRFWKVCRLRLTSWNATLTGEVMPSVITIVDPKDMIDKLWGKQRIKERETYRLMRYVLLVNHDGKVLIQNTVTGRLVVLSDKEAEVLEKLPMLYNPIMEQLVIDHYLVPEDYDEHQQVVKLRNILWKLVDPCIPKDITYYTILPTTACNARCWYCYENNMVHKTMTEEVAERVVSFIKQKCGGKAVTIRWFGGEPTLAANRIDQISKGLQENGIEYTSNVTTNGYLFDEDMVIKAKNLWHTDQVNISIDGTEETYNRVKNFIGVRDNPYQRMMRNAEILMKHGIAVVMRMNYDQNTWEDFPKLVKETKKRFHDYKHWMLHPHQINVELPESIQLERQEWFSLKNADLFDLANDCGVYQKSQKLPSLSFAMCQAGNDACTTILPDGSLVCCPELLEDDQIKGNIYEGIVNPDLANSWKTFADHKKCQTCPLFPDCARMKYCSAKDRCSGKRLFINRMSREIVRRYDEVLNK